MHKLTTNTLSNCVISCSTQEQNQVSRSKLIFQIHKQTHSVHNHIPSFIEFRKATNLFQSKLQEDTDIVNQSKNIFISADKSTNIYAMEKDNYNRYFRKNVTKTYKKTDKRKIKSINYETKLLLKNYQLRKELRKCKEMKHL